MARSAISVPDAEQTVKLAVQTLEGRVLDSLVLGVCPHVVVADKTPHLVTLPRLPGSHPRVQTGGSPYFRPNRTVRDKWHRDKLFGFVFVAYGEVDLMISRRVVTCRSDDYVFFLPRAWRSHGSESHWERDDVENAASDLFWVFVNPDGAFVHFCWSRGLEHRKSPNIFVRDLRLFQLVNWLGEELMDSSSPAATQLLWFFFDRLRSKLETGSALPSEFIVSTPSTPEGTNLSVAERAVQFVEANLAKQFTLEDVARAVFVSRSKLASEFPAHSGETLANYVLRRRMETAQHLLSTTSLKITAIAWHSGFTDPDYFSTAFRRFTGKSPVEFRNWTLSKEKK